MKVIFFIFLAFLGFIVDAQNKTFYIVDQESLKPVSNVYAFNNNEGRTSNADGKILLDVPTKLAHPHL